MKKKYYTWDSVHAAATKIALDMYKENWRPDYIVGITRGGMPLAVILSHMLDIPCNALKISLRDGSASKILLGRSKQSRRGCLVSLPI